MNKIFHPINGDLVDVTDLKENELLIPDHLHKPSIWIPFYDEGEDTSTTRLYGMEFELNLVDENNNPKIYDVCREILKITNSEGRHAHIMVDNSVRNGIELVFAPMSFAYMFAHIDFVGLFDLFQNRGVTASHDTGFHIHVGIQHTLRERNLILKLFAISYPMWLEISRRKIIRLQDRYVSTAYFMMNDRTRERHQHNLRSLNDKGSSRVDFKSLYFDNYDIRNRYTAVNFANRNTVEFRIFSGAPTYETFFDCIDFTDRFICLVDEISVTREDNVPNSDAFVLRTGTQDYLERTVRTIRKGRLLQDKRLYYNHAYLVNTYWYQSSPAHADLGDYIMQKVHYETYLSYIEEIHTLDINVDYFDIQETREKINDFLVGVLKEIVVVEDDFIGAIPILYNTRYQKISRHELKNDYVILKAINSDLLITEIK